MGVMEVDTDGLRALSSQCEQLADEIAISGAPRPSEMAGQATTVAVTTVNASVDAAVQQLVGRMSATAAKLSCAAVDYTAQDAESAEDIRTTVV